MCGFKYGDKGADEPQSCFIPYLIISSLMQIWWVFTVVSETKLWLSKKSRTKDLKLISQTASMFLVDLLPVELVLGFHRSLKVIEEDMDELFGHR